MLKLEGDWRFDSPGPLPEGVSDAFMDLINRVAGQGDRWSIIEHFKSYFASAAGAPHHRSSSVSWAMSDLGSHMADVAANAPLFIDAFYSACESLKAANPDIAVPEIKRINRILIEASVGYEIRGDELVATQNARPIPVPERPPSLDQEAQRIITETLANADRALAEGNGRQAVQELLWLLETIATAFRGLETSEGSVQGRYFNKIVGELRADSRGKHQEQILTWMIALHGFLSSPTGGGIRHGVDLAEGVAAGINEARLYCNLIRSYTAYLIAEHERLKS